MTRQFVSQLQPQQSVDEVYRVVDKQMRSNRQGNPYLLIQLGDRTGVVSGMKWNANQATYDAFQKSDFVRVQAAAQIHQGLMQLIVHRIDAVDPTQVDPADFESLDRNHAQQQWNQLGSLLESIEHPQIRALVMAFWNDPQLQEKYQRAPAGIKAHHSHAGGLLDHVLQLTRLADAASRLYPRIDRSLLLAGVFLHDIGKLEELAFDGELTYSDPGQLLGHLVQGVQMVDRRIADLEKSSGEVFPDQLRWRLQHMVVSHHGQLEHGSPKVPMTMEAILLHHLDDLDAKLQAAMEAIAADRNADSPWTNFHPLLGRKLYKDSLGLDRR